MTVSPDSFYYEATVVIKVDVKKEAWDSGCDETFGLQQIVSPDSSEDGPVLIAYERIDKKEFDDKKYTIFTEEGGI